MKNFDNFKNQLISNDSENHELVSKNEFKYLAKIIFDEEILLDIIVGSIDNQAWMLLVTDQRLLMAKKESLIGSQVKQFGLEEILDLKLETFGDMGALTFIPESSDLFKLDYLKLKEAKSFGRNLAKAINAWTEKIRKNLI
ncbi:PH domain-containing protein [[Acholeplasma] multilocale]|uniref:PH domain-containing protein n=1 Tax=[Acholeplasma] multilocale TaxID=264638 RepID=UPI00047AA226|nr:PH domain-containing protein [[Acholeplasma] multilocale]